ncbi:hypothetical protein GCM10028805_57150 [Spirosoma harenae]
MVFQRNLANEAAVLVAGMGPANATLIEARFVPLIAGQGTATNWTKLNFISGTPAFQGKVTVSAGWYRLDVRAKAGAALLTQTQVGRVGVGEVFVVAGQSNASGGFLRASNSVEDRVSCLDFRQDSISDQMLPLRFSPASYGSAIGPGQPPHLWSTLGDILVQRLNVPVLFFGAALGGSSSTEWKQGAIGNLGNTTNSQVYRRLGEVLLHYLPRTGARAVLWHQGETDTYYGVNNQTYYNNVNTVIQKSRQQVSPQPLAWMVSRVSYNNYMTSPGIITAQNQLIADLTNIFPGPASDSIVGPDNRPDNVHLKGAGLVKFINSWNQALTADFFQHAIPYVPTGDSVTLITSGYTLPLVRKQGDTLAVASLRSNPYNAGNQYVAQIIRAADGVVVYESSPSLDNPILVKIPNNLPDGQYRLRTRSTNPVLLSTLGEPFTVQQSASPSALTRIVRQPIPGGTPFPEIKRFTYRYEPGTHGFFAMIESSVPVEMRLERIDGGSFTDSGWYVVPPSYQAPNYDEFANFNYIRNYPPTIPGVDGVSPGRYRYSVRRQGDTGQGLWYDVEFLDMRTILYENEQIPTAPPLVTITDLPLPVNCQTRSINVSVEVSEGTIGNNNTYSVRISDSTGSFASETIIGSGHTSPITATIPANLPSGNNYRLRVVASDPAVASQPSQPFAVCSYADLSMSMRLSNRVPAVNEPITLTLVLTNDGPQSTSGVTAQSRLPTGIEFVDAPNSAVSAANNIVSIQAGSIPPWSSIPFEFRIKANQNGHFATSAQIMTSSQNDPDSQPGSGTGDGQDDTAIVDMRTLEANETGEQVISPNPNQVPLPPVIGYQIPTDPAKADLSLTIKSDKLAVGANQVIKCNLIVANRGGANATNVILSTLLPSGWQPTVTTGLTVTGQTITANIGSVSAGSSGSLTLFIRVTNSGTIRSQIMSVSPSDSDSTPANGYTNGEDDEASVSIRTM